MISKALVAASAKPIVLSLLLNGENYGYRIIQRVRQVSGGALEWSEAMLYPVLHRLEDDGLIRSQWTVSPEGRMRKYYGLTAAGRAAFHQEKTEWLCVHKSLLKLWEPAENPEA
jgi:PadR family transcriptional regulator, regulatory protein PadR